MASDPPVLRPDWPAPPGVGALVTTRHGGVSEGPFAGFNLGDHVGDAPAAVAENRRRLQAMVPAEPGWLRQVHGIDVVRLPAGAAALEADAAWTDQSGQACAVLTADCLPVLFCDRAGSRVAAAHAGWRGLVGGVLEATVAALQVPGPELLAWLGPAIGPGRFEVGEEVREAFLKADAQAEPAFRPSPAGRWLADLYALARRRLAMAGVEAVYGGGLCTYEDARFYSYRRDGRTGRFASLVWLRAEG